MQPKTRPHAEFARRLFTARKRYELKRNKDLDQKELAERMGVSDATVSQWFNGRQMPKVDQLKHLARILDADPGWLTFGSNDEFTKPDEGGQQASPSRKK